MKTRPKPAYLKTRPKPAYRREFHEDEFHEDDDDDGTIRDGEGVRVPLLWADGDENIRWITPQPVRQRVADSAPPRPAFDWAAFHRPGVRTFEMLCDAASALRLDDAAGDPVEAARAERIARQSTMWRDNIYITYNAAQPTSNEGGGGQVRGGPRVQTLAKRPQPAGGGQPYNSGADPDALAAEEDRAESAYGWVRVAASTSRKAAALAGVG